jgi:hypothetical protein
MKKIITKLVFTLLLFSAAASFSQSFMWVKNNTHNITSNPDIAKFPSACDASGNLVIGTIWNYKQVYSSEYYGDVTIRKYNNSGIELFNKTLTGKALVKDIEPGASDEIYLYGTFMDTLRIDASNFLLNTGSGFNLDEFLIKLSSSGNLVWVKNISSLYPGKRIGALKIRQSDLFLGLESTNPSLIIKMDLNGNEISSINQHLVTSTALSLSSVDIDASGNVFASGSCGSGNIAFGNLTQSCPFVYSLYFAKYNSAGLCQWVKFVQDVTSERPRIINDAQGNLYAAGDLNGSFAFGSLQSQGPSWVYDFYLTKIDPSGNFLWLKEVPNTNTTGDAALGKIFNIRVDASSNVYITGFQRGTVNWGNITTTIQGTGNGLVVLKYNSSGDLLWGKTAGGTGGVRGDAISLDNSGNIFISGNFGLTANFDAIQLSGTGYINSFITKLTNPVSVGVVNNNAPVSYSLSNYPNPFNPATNIKFSIVKSGNVKLTVYNMLGKEIKGLVNGIVTKGTYEINFDASGLASGVYIYKLATEEKTFTGKMTLLK